MNCKDAQSLIDGYLDGELDLVRNLEIDKHLQECALCSQGYKGHQSLRDAIRGGALYFKPPSDLRGRIQLSLRTAAKAEASPRVLSWRWLNVTAPMAAAAVVVLALVPLLRGPSADELLSREVIASHVRSLMANHLADVPSSDQHTVKPWFNGKLDFSPPVADLAEKGFPLVGGRLDYLDQKPVAALIYQRQKHFINLFVWPSSGGSEGATRSVTRQGYHVLHWTRSGMTYWAVSDLEENQLREFTQLIQNQAQARP
jgi:anti-sigma factor RsiW